MQVVSGLGKKTEIVPLTGLRGLAALVVTLYHFGQPYHNLDVKTGFIVPYGYLAVDLFYILSGFVITYAYGDDYLSFFSIIRYRNFFFMRLGRLYPAYLLALLLFLAKMNIDFASDHPLNSFKFSDTIGNLLMATGWGLNIHPIVVDSWSVSAELVCYAAFPVLVWLLLGRPVSCCIAAGLALFGLYSVDQSGQGIRGPMDVVMQTSFYPLLRCVCGFVVGMLSYRVWRKSFVRDVLGLDVSAVTLFGLICLFVAVGVQDLVFYMCFPVLVVLCSSGSNIALFLLGNRGLQFLGRISYSLYLVHDIFVTGSVRTTHYLHLWFGFDRCYIAVAIFGMAGACLMATLSHRWVEIPGQRLVNSLINPIGSIRPA